MSSTNILNITIHFNYTKPDVSEVRPKILQHQPKLKDMVGRSLIASSNDINTKLSFDNLKKILQNQIDIK